MSWLQVLVLRAWVYLLVACVDAKDFKRRTAVVLAGEALQ